MEDQINLDAWRQDGQRLWQHIQTQNEIVFLWHNPWLNMFLFGSFLFILAVIFFIFFNWYSAAPIAVFAFYGFYKSIRFKRLEKKHGKLHIFYTPDCFGIGGANERIAILYSSVFIPEYINMSTFNDNYFELPVPPEQFDCILTGRDGVWMPWDKKSFKMAIAEMKIQNGKLLLSANPNKLLADFFSTFYPLMLYLKSEGKVAGFVPPER